MNNRPLSPAPTKEAELAGYQIEDRLFRCLNHWVDIGRVAGYFKPDAFMILPDGQIEVIEVKYAERFVPPPFEGQGMPVSQAQRYMHLYRVHGVRTRFIVDEGTAVVWQYVDVLEDGPSHITRGTIKTPRKVWSIDSFIVVKSMQDIFGQQEIKKEADTDYPRKPFPRGEVPKNWGPALNNNSQLCFMNFDTGETWA